MTLNIDLLKKKIIYRSSYRGTKEMDKLLGSFTKKYIEILSLKDLIDLEKLLDIDDTNLYNYYNDLDCDFEFKENYINSLFKNFIYDIEKN
jgi:antitoxin CptB